MSLGAFGIYDGTAPIRAITPDTALLLGEFFGVDGAGFLNMQTHYDLEMAREKLATKLELVREHALRHHPVT